MCPLCLRQRVYTDRSRSGGQGFESWSNKGNSRNEKAINHNQIQGNEVQGSSPKEIDKAKEKADKNAKNKLAKENKHEVRGSSPNNTNAEVQGSSPNPGKEDDKEKEKDEHADTRAAAIINNNNTGPSPILGKAIGTGTATDEHAETRAAAINNNNETTTSVKENDDKADEDEHPTSITPLTRRYTPNHIGATPCQFFDATARLEPKETKTANPDDEEKKKTTQYRLATMNKKQRQQKEQQK